MTAKAPRQILWKLLFVLSTALFSYMVLATQFDPRFNPHSLFGKPDQCRKCHVYYRGNL